MTTIKAIDCHVHPQTEEFIRAKGARAKQMEQYYGKAMPAVSMAELADEYRSRSMMAVLLNSDDETVSGTPPVPNDVLGRAVADHADVFLGFGGVDPWKGEAALTEARRCKEELGLRGLKFNPARQAFFPDDERFFPLWETAQELGLVVLFHTGFPGAGAGKPGGMGYRLQYTRPVPHLDNVAADFPELKIIGAHPSWPWHEEALAVARHKSNYYMDLSGYAPKHIPDVVFRHTDTILRHKVLFGTDWPTIGIDRWLDEFAALPLREETRDRVLLRNAAELLGIDL